MTTVPRPQRWCLERSGHRAWAGSNADLLWYADDTAHRGASRTAPVWTISVGLANITEIQVADGRSLRGGAVLVPPGVRHRRQTGGPCLTLWVEPGAVSLPHDAVVLSSGRAAELVELCSLAPCAEAVLDTESDERRAAVLDVLGARVVSTDARLSDVLGRIEDVTKLNDAASEVGVSPRRLRRLAQDQLGTSLAPLRRWRRLHAAAIQLPFRSAAEVAVDAGFSDQPHLNRTIRTMIGSPPGQSPAASRSGAT